MGLQLINAPMKTLPKNHALWKPGQSGNPKGRPRGALNPTTRLRKLIDVEPILKKLQKAAEKGDVQAARTLLERALPVRRPTAEPVELPALESAGTLTEKGHAVLDAIAAGTLPPDLGAQLVTALGGLAKIVEIDELAARVAALEAERGTEEQD